MSDRPADVAPGSDAVLAWARSAGLVTDVGQERRLAAMRLDVLARGALPRGEAGDVALTSQWAAFICWVDDRIDREGLGSVPGAVEEFTAPLREVLTTGAPSPRVTAPHAAVLARLLERTAEGMSRRWRERFAADYTDFLDATEQEAALRRGGVRMSLDTYVRLRRRTITLAPMLDVLEHTAGTPLLEAPHVDAQLRDLREAVADVAGWTNDLASATDDDAAGQDNVVTVLARVRGCSTAQARQQVAAMIDERHTGFQDASHVLRTPCGLPPHESAQLHGYLDLVETFMTATLRWLACTGRFTPPPVGRPVLPGLDASAPAGVSERASAPRAGAARGERTGLK